MSYVIYSFNVQTKKGKQKYSIEASPDDMLGEVFVDIVKGSQSTDFPISVKRSDGSDIEWRFHVVDGQDEIKEVFPDQTFQQNTVMGEQLIYAYDDSDIGADRSPIMIRRGGAKKEKDEASISIEDGMMPGGDMNTIEMDATDSDWMAELSADTASEDAPVAGGPKFPHAVRHHMEILQEVLSNNPDMLYSTYDWSLLSTWGAGWDRVPIRIRGVHGVIGMFEDEPLLGDDHEVIIHIPASFPDSRPKVIPSTPMWHPNIRPESDFEEGDICWIGQWTGDELYRCLERLMANVIEIIQFAKVRGGDHARMNEDARDWVVRKFGSLTGYAVPHSLKMLRRAEADGPAITL